MAVIGSMLLVSCNFDSASNGDESRQEPNHPPSIKLVQIIQEVIRADRSVTVRVETDDPEHDPVTIRFRWMVNDLVVGDQSDSTFDPKRVKRGDKVMVEVTPNDGKHDGLPLRSRAVVVGNTPPVVRVLTIDPSDAKAEDTLSIILETWDSDQDDILSAVKWWRNKQLVAEGEELTSLTAKGWSRDDVAMVSVIARDKYEPGIETFSQPVILGNSPPQFTSAPSVTVKEGHFEYQVLAMDAEGDRISYKLEIAPPGMAINGQTGQLRWFVPTDSVGTYQVKIVIADDHGGTSFQEFTLSQPKQKAS
jgi:Putative Ig domain